MKRIKTFIAAAMIAIAGVNLANAQSLSDILGKLGNMTGNKENTEQSTGSGSGLGGTLGNILEGVFSSPICR